MTGAAILPSGTNAQRAAIATPVAGMARLNTSITALEYYNGTNWIPLSPNAPTCLVRATATQNVVSGVTTKVLNLNDVAFDNYSFFNTTTNQFKPTIPGCYQVNCLIRMRALPVGTTDVSLSQVYLYKNGLLYSRLTEIVGPLFSVLQTQGNTIVQMNGTTDYLEMWGQATASSPCFDYVGSAFTSFFSAVLVGV